MRCDDEDSQEDTDKCNNDDGDQDSNDRDDDCEEKKVENDEDGHDYHDYHVIDDNDTLQGEGEDGGDLPLVHKHGPGPQQHPLDGRVHRLAGGPQAALWPRPHRASRGGHMSEKENLTKKSGCRRSI